jgi:hypothetical protein
MCQPHRSLMAKSVIERPSASEIRQICAITGSPLALTPDTTAALALLTRCRENRPGRADLGRFEIRAIGWQIDDPGRPALLVKATTYGSSTPLRIPRRPRESRRWCLHPQP